MKLMFVAAEGAPFAKTGGLGDVIGALPKSLVKKGHDVAVVLPYYDVIERKYGQQVEDLFSFYTQVGWRWQYVGVKRLVHEEVSFYFIDNQYYFHRGQVYGFDDDHERFAFFQLAAIDMMEKVDFVPDVLHVHDYHTAMIPFLLKEKYAWITAYQSIKTVFTIHNIEFQGQFAPETLGDLFGMGMNFYESGSLRWHNCLNWMKAALVYADWVTTVSPSYAQEIMTPEFGKGLDSAIRMIRYKLSGVINGIDTGVFDPASDPHLVKHFSVGQLEDKALNKAALQERLGLPVRSDTLLIGVVSRLTDQKGFDLVLEAMNEIIQEDVQIVLLGTGYPQFEEGFSWFSQHYPDKVSATISFDLAFAQQIYAASDLFLMPSAFEPCGLSQMIAMRYGSLPLVHEVGGLRDTVLPYNYYDGSGTGFGFQEFSVYWLVKTLEEALWIFNHDQATWRHLQEQAMTRDFSWDTASQAYDDLYHHITF
ncbi:glycogen synthase GlgA [Streptococcus cuniculipharyngis]|uniref:Glycogen synthase n=1 Tax=Streptococcus cuniculipharyngis TaxID=1562651 RepID=A0A5C5SCA0_9STRE|nr:glycogen synthase GlgA [Streptococcus cuniculipharyngis]TWS98727.1 glycogen synthase GlgA [Streptococcus cuniculipharyngis]